MDAVVERGNMWLALRRVEANRGAAGADDMPVESLRAYLKEHWPRIKEELLEGRHDLILAQLPVRSGDLTVARLFREPLKLAVAQDHPLAGRGEVSDGDLVGLDILALPPGYPLHAQIATLCEEVGAQLRQDYEGSSLDALRQMTALGMGASFLPALYAGSEVRPETGDVALLRFRDDRFMRSVGLAWRRRAAQGALIDRVTEVIRSVAQTRFKGVLRME